MVNEDKFYEKQIGFSYWYVKHKLLLKNILTVVLTVIIILLVAYNLYLLVFNLAIFQDDYQQVITDFTTPNSDYQALRQLSLPQPVQIGQMQSFANRDKYDIIAEIANPNQKWWASFNYQFQIGQELTVKRQGFILPGQRKNLFGLALERGNLASQLVLSDVSWEKEINFEKLYQERYRFDIKETEFLSARELGVGEDIPVNRLIFKVVNESAYNFRNVNFLVFLKAGNQIAAVNQIVLESFLSGQTRESAVTFFQALPRITSVDIIPEVNILDENVFLRF